MMNSTEVLDKVIDYQDLQKLLKSDEVTDDTLLWVAGATKTNRLTSRGENGFTFEYVLPFEIYVNPWFEKMREKHDSSDM